MYSLDQYGMMIGDKVRFPPYAEAVRRSVRPGDTVADLGSGPGVFALLACRAGARRVFAIDLDGIVDFGRQLAAANGFSDRIEFLRGDSRQIHLPEKVNVIVSDLRGSLPFFTRAIESLNDARRRFLAEGGILIPGTDILCAALIEDPGYYESLTEPWSGVSGLDLSGSLPIVLNGIYRKQLKPEQILSKPKGWYTLDYRAGASSRGSGSVSLEAARRGTAHGIGLWFETQLVEGIGFSTIPGSEETVYGHGFLPLLEPVALEAGEEVRVELHADPVSSDYVWRWDSWIPARNERPAKHFQQSTFFGANFSPSSLRKRSADFVPILSEAGQAERWMLQAIDGNTPLQEIAAKVATRFPHVFSRVEDAFSKAGEIADKLSR
jgi:protein arginine N-methyltransferase 1